ncbi:MAG: hypothetical protein RLT05_17490 [Bauldia litoralis]
MTWEAETPLLTSAVARTAALATGCVFALVLGAAYAGQAATPGTALLTATAGAGAGVMLLAAIVFGLFSNTVRKRFTATDRGFAATIVSPRFARHIPGAARDGDLNAWTLVERVRLDAEYGRVLIKLRTTGWQAIHCPDGGFVGTAREIRRLIDDARGVEAAPPPQAWTALPPARSAQDHLSGTAA